MSIPISAVPPTAEHGQAALAVDRWMRDPHQQVFKLFGPAGTGKTTLIRDLVESSGRHWLFASLTGKAALVMRRKGCVGARTIHSLIFRPEEDGETVDASGRRQVKFRPWRDSPLTRAAGIVVDEGSMIDGAVGRHLLSFGKKILMCGDPFQLPPVGGDGFFMSGAPDFLLTEVHRQACESGILDLATFVREGGEPFDWRPHGDDCEVLSRTEVSGSEIWRRMLSADQVIVGTNATRHRFNSRHRLLLGLGGKSSLPIPGDKVVCLRNDHELGLLNGSLWRVDASAVSRDRLTVSMELSSEDGSDPVLVRSWSHHFLGQEGDIPDACRRQYQEFDFGYHLTCHKAQGDQWPRVVVFDESHRFDASMTRRWMYTAITRASDRLLVVV